MRKDMKVEQGDAYLRVADPVVNGVIKASSTSVSLPCDAVDGDVLISLDVNGTKVAHRELFTMDEGSVDVGDYTVAYSGGAVTISTTSNNDVVSIRIEPVEVVVSDAFRAAVKKDAPETPNELPAVTDADDGKVLTADSGVWAAANPSGGRFVVTFTYDDATETWSADKTFAECVAAWEAGKNLFAFVEGTYTPMTYVVTENSDVTYIAFYIADAESHTISGYGIDAEGVYDYSGGE